MAPFKLPQDYIDILGGFDSLEFAKFKELFKKCFRDVRKHAERIITLVELMQKGQSHYLHFNRQLETDENGVLVVIFDRFKFTLFRERGFNITTTEGTFRIVSDSSSSRRICREIDLELCYEFIHETLRVRLFFSILSTVKTLSLIRISLSLFLFLAVTPNCSLFQGYSNGIL
jgi:hypothetical protein